MLIKMTKRFERNLDPDGNRKRILPAGLTFNVDRETYDAILAAGAGEALETKNQELHIAAEHDANQDGDDDAVEYTKSGLQKLKKDKVEEIAVDIEAEYSADANKDEIIDAILSKQAADKAAEDQA